MTNHNCTQLRDRTIHYLEQNKRLYAQMVSSENKKGGDTCREALAFLQGMFNLTEELLEGWKTNPVEVPEKLG